VRSEDAGTTLLLALDLYLLDCRARGCKKTTIAYYRAKIGHFIAWLESQGVVEVESISRDDIRRYLVHMQNTGHNAGGVHGHARAIRAWLNSLTSDGILQKSPMPKMPKMPQPAPEAYSREDVALLLDAAANDRDRALLLFLVDTGVRASELVALDVGDADFTTGAVNVRYGKGDRERVVFFGFRTQKALKRYLWGREDAVTPSSPLFASLRSPQEGGRMTTSSLRTVISRTARRAGLPGRGPHTLRRTFAIFSLRAGMDIYTLARLMGHADIGVLKHYLALADTDTAEAHRRHGPVNGYLTRKEKKHV